LFDIKDRSDIEFKGVLPRSHEDETSETNGIRGMGVCVQI